MAKPASATKLIHMTASPFSDPAWPNISPTLESTILEPLLSLLSPVGTYRDQKSPPSKGRRRKKKKAVSTSVLEDESPPEKDTSCAHAPDILSSLTVGYNSTVRCLETMAQHARSDASAHPHDEGAHLLPSTLFAVFICVAHLPDVMTSTLPLLVAMASVKRPVDDAIRLVPVSGDGVARIAHAMRQPRVSVLGVRTGNNHAQSLESLLRSKVAPVEISWLRESTSNVYLPLKIHSREVPSNPKAKELKRKRDKT